MPLYVALIKSQILYALDQGQSCFVGDAVWQDIPWRKKPKTPYDQIYDFLIRAPALRNKGESLQFLDNYNRLRVATELIWKLWDMDVELQTVYDSLEKSHEGPLYWAELAKNRALHGDPEEGFLFPVAFHFPSLTIANTLLMFWGVQAIIWHGMSQLSGLLRELQIHFADAAKVDDEDGDEEPKTDTISTLFRYPALEHRADFAAPCRNIFQSIEYGLADDMLDQGPKCVAGPLRIGYETLLEYPQYQKEVEWATRAQEMVQSRSLRLLRYYIPRR